MILVIATILLSALTAAPADVTGKWDGRLTATRSDGTKHEDSVLLILNQKDGTISGSIGGSESDQHPITTGTIDGDKVVIVARHATNGREYRLELTLQNEELNGTVANDEQRVEVRTKRRKE
jgi:predicted dehydrogenase